MSAQAVGATEPLIEFLNAVHGGPARQLVSQRSPQNAPILSLLLKAAVSGGASIRIPDLCRALEPQRVPRSGLCAGNAAATRYNTFNDGVKSAERRSNIFVLGRPGGKLI